MSQVGFIGIGTMGAAMTKRLLGAGHEVVAWNRSQQALAPLLEAGAQPAAHPSDALACGIAFSMLANDAAIDAVFDEPTLRRSEGSVHINMATVSLDAARELHARHLKAGVDYAAAPVLGRPKLAEKGQLNIVAAGSGDALDRADEFFPAMGKRTWRIGEDPALANLVKLGVNYNLIHTMQALAESLNLMERSGVDGETFVEVLTDAAYTGTAYGGYGPIIASKEYLPRAFSVELGLKDLRLVRHAAQEVSAALPTAATLQEIFEQTLADPDLSELDWSAMAEITRRRAE